MGARRKTWPRVWREVPLRSSYDVVVIGGGVHGLAAAYYLAANHGITNVAVLEKSLPGKRGLRPQHGHPAIQLPHTRGRGLLRPLPGAVQDPGHRPEHERDVLPARSHNPGAQRRVAADHALEGRGQQAPRVNSSVIGPADIKKLAPVLDTSSYPRYPILGALYHPPGGIIRHDAVVWGYAGGADSLGLEIHQKTEVVDIIVTGGDGPDGKGPGGRITGVRTNRGDISAPVVLNCTAGWATLISDMVGVKLPISTRPLQAAVTEPVKVFLPVVVVSGTLHVYVSQTARGELVFGASVDPYNTYSIRGSLEFTEQTGGHLLELMPGISRMCLLRQWAGLCDMLSRRPPEDRRRLLGLIGSGRRSDVERLLAVAA